MRHPDFPDFKTPAGLSGAVKARSGVALGALLALIAAARCFCKRRHVDA